MTSSTTNRSTSSWTMLRICSTPTRTSFEVLFPRLRPGGLFVIEDWNWQHLRAKGRQRAIDEPGSDSQVEFQRRLSEALADKTSPEYAAFVRGRNCRRAHRSAGDTEPGRDTTAHVLGDPAAARPSLVGVGCQPTRHPRPVGGGASRPGRTRPEDLPRRRRRTRPLRASRTPDYVTEPDERRRACSTSSGHLRDERVDGFELQLVAQALDEQDASGFAVEVTVEVEDVRLEERSVGVVVERRTTTERDGGRPVLSVWVRIPTGVDAVGR